MLNPQRDMATYLLCLWTKNAAYHISEGFVIKPSASMAALTVSPEGPQDRDKQGALLATIATAKGAP